MMPNVSPLPESLWRERARVHAEELAPLTTAFRRRRASGDLHPVHDFLFTYYPYRAGRLEQWHPALGEVLERSERELPPYFSQKHYRISAGEVALDDSILRDKDRERLGFSHRLLSLTTERPPNFGCYGLHEWAMVYRSDNPRHQERAPLRLSDDEVASFVESQSLVCSHFDATRFFTPAATPRNRLQPNLETREDFEQPGCIHANMDLYKWAFKAMPWVGSDLLRRTFFLALELRELDMRASPYDLSNYGYDAIPIETPKGRTEYVRLQQELSNKAALLRVELLKSLGILLLNVTNSPRPPLQKTSSPS